jgi:hypothetical protein
MYFLTDQDQGVGKFSTSLFLCLVCAHLFFFFFLIVVLCRGTLWHLQKFLQCIKYITLEFPPSTSLSHCPPIPGSVSTGIIFAFICMFIHCLHFIHPPTPFPTTSPSHWCQHPSTPPSRTCSALLFSYFVEEKCRFASLK